MMFKSRLEEHSFEELRKGKRKGKYIFAYEGEKLPYYLEKKYIPDWTLTWPNGKVMYLEMKGWLRPSDRTKLIAVKKANPNIDIRIVFQTDNKLNKNSKTRYSKWAEKHGFPWAIKYIPKEWLQSQRTS
jgi:hypothetical protein